MSLIVLVHEDDIPEEDVELLFNFLQAVSAEAEDEQHKVDVPRYTGMLLHSYPST